MTYGQLLRKLASLSEEQLKMPVNLRPMNSSYEQRRDRFKVSHVSIWDDNREDPNADVDIFIELE